MSTRRNTCVSVGTSAALRGALAEHVTLYALSCIFRGDYRRSHRSPNQQLRLVNVSLPATRPSAMLSCAGAVAVAVSGR